MTECTNSQRRNLPHPCRLSVSLWRTCILLEDRSQWSLSPPLWLFCEECLGCFVQTFTTICFTQHAFENDGQTYMFICVCACVKAFSAQWHFDHCVCTPWYSSSALTFWPRLDFSVTEVCVTFILLVGVGGTFHHRSADPYSVPQLVALHRGRWAFFCIERQPFLNIRDTLKHFKDYVFLSSSTGELKAAQVTYTHSWTTCTPRTLMPD